MWTLSRSRRGDNISEDIEVVTQIDVVRTFASSESSSSTNRWQSNVLAGRREWHGADNWFHRVIQRKTSASESLAVGYRTGTHNSPLFFFNWSCKFEITYYRTAMVFTILSNYLVPNALCVSTDYTWDKWVKNTFYCKLTVTIRSKAKYLF